MKHEAMIVSRCVADCIIALECPNGSKGKEGNMSEISRRAFLGGAALVGAGAMAGGLMGCSSGAAAGGDEGSAPVQHNPESTETADIVVVGSGTAGMSCAVRCQQLGAKVVMLEKTGMYGGSSNYAEGIGALNSYFHKELGMEFSLDEAFLRTQDYHHWGADSAVLHHFLEESGATIDWLHDECGIKFFKPAVTAPTSYPSWHLVAMEDGSVTRMMEGFFQPMVAYAESIGLDMRLESPATGLIVEDGTVKGVYVEHDGSEYAIEAENVVLATGGWANNADLWEEFAHMDIEKYTNWGAPGRDGDGITWARELGAALHFPNNIMYASTAIPGQTEFEEPAGWIFTWNPGLRVNAEGKRFFNELLMADFSQAGNAIANEDACYTIIDQAYFDMCTQVALPVGLDSLGPNYLTGQPFTIGIDAVAQAVEDGRILKADTIDEVAEYIGVDAGVLQETIDEYNGYAAAGEDPVFGCPAMGLVPVQTAPFYCVKNGPALFATVGGLRCNTQYQVLNEDGEVIPNLYALGGDNSTYSGAGYDVGIMAGSQQGWCATGGRLVAEQLFG